MKKKIYDEIFQKFWENINPWWGNKGSKQQAEKEFLELECTEEDVCFLTECYHKQLNYVNKMLEYGREPPHFQHVCRWLKNRRFEDEIPESINAAGRPTGGNRLPKQGNCGESPAERRERFTREIFSEPGTNENGCIVVDDDDTVVRFEMADKGR